MKNKSHLMKYKVISSNSQGNAVLYFNSILVDIGVSYRKLTPYKDDIKLVLLTHRHKDHLNMRTLRLLQQDRPNVIIACGQFMVEHLWGIKNVYVLDYGKWHDFGSVKVAPIKLYHDVPNYGYRVFWKEEKLFHATDTSTLDGITAIGYTIYAIEDNYCEIKLKRILETSTEYEHGWRSRNTHLSTQQREKFIKENARGEYIDIRLHGSTKYKGE